MSSISFDYDELAEICREFGIRDVYLFGSTVEGFAHPGSDTDIGITFSEGLPEKNRMKLYGDIYSAFNGVFGLKNLDLVFVEELPLHIRFKAVTKGELLYTADLEASLNYKEYIINMYRDWKFFIDEFYQGLLENDGQ
jgi:predicted nucleotidyltransferase